MRIGGIKSVLVTLSVALIAASGTGSLISARTAKSHDAVPAVILTHSCSACHGSSGSSPNGGGVPRIGGMNAGYLVHALKSMASGTWQSAVMSPVAASLTNKQMRMAASYFSKQSRVYSAAKRSQVGEVGGWLLATQGDWKRKVPACTLCHGERGVGIGRYFPRLANQHAAYIRAQIHEWRIGNRHNDPLGLMQKIAKRLNKKQIEQVAWYFSKLPRRSKAFITVNDMRATGFVDSHGRFVPPPKGIFPSGPFGSMIRFGRNIFVHTSSYAQRYSGDALTCENCHIDAGRLANSAPMWAAYVAYPAYRKKNRRVNTFSQRLQDCFRYSLNGIAPPRRSKVLLALEVYSYYLAHGAPTGRILNGSGYPKLASSLHGMSYTRGRLVFRNHCAVCHGTDGQGRRTNVGTQGFPPLWGSASYNWGAGMSDIEQAARFIKANMPLGLGGTLTVQQTWDVAKFVDSHQRPQDPRFNGSVSSTRAKYHNTSMSMYGRLIKGARLGGPLGR